jgi:hypothetical protein
MVGQGDKGALRQGVVRRRAAARRRKERTAVTRTPNQMSLRSQMRYVEITCVDQ